MSGAISLLVLGLIVAAVAYMYQRVSVANQIERLNQEMKLAEIKETQKHIDIIKTRTLKTVEEYQDARSNYHNRYPKPAAPPSDNKPSGPQG